MVKFGAFICSFGLLALWFAGIRAPGASVWFTWVIGVAAIAGFAVTAIAHPSEPRRVYAGLPGVMSVALLALWLVGLGTHATAWMVWWDFLFCLGFAFVAIAAGLEEAPVIRVPQRGVAPRSGADYAVDPYEYYGNETLSGFEYQPRGGYEGLGPKDYHRKDEQVADEICARMTRNGELDASGIEVRVKDGDVTLSGTVDSRRAWRIADAITESVVGVRSVHNELKFREQGKPKAA